MPSRIVIHVEDTCTPKDVAEIYNQLWSALARPAAASYGKTPLALAMGSSLPDPEIEIIVPHGAIDRVPAR